MESEKKSKLTRSDIKEIINDVEAKFPVDKWIIDGIHIWPVIRIQLYEDLSYKLFSLESPDYLTRTTFINRMIRILEIIKGLSKFMFAYIWDHKKNGKVEKVDAVFLRHGIHFTKVNNYWYDRFCDPFIDYLKSKNLTSLSLTPLHGYFIPRYNSSMFIQPILDYIKIIYRFILKISHTESEQLLNFSDFLDYLEFKNYNTQKITLQLIRRRVFIIRLIADFFKKLLEKSKPSLGFLVSYYETTGFAYNLACREFGIPSIDIQHGVQGELHLAYGSWSNVPEKGYELLPSLFWCWSDFEANAIQKWCKKVFKWHKQIVGGNLWLNQWVDGNSKFVKHYDTLISKLKEPNKNCKHILFTQNEPIESENFKNTFYVIKNSPPFWFWWIRIHPGQLKIKSKVKKMLNENKISNYNIDYATDLPLYAILRNIDIHLTCSSSTVTEAEIFGIPSVLASKYGNGLFPRQIYSGRAISAFAPEDIINAINHQLKILDELKQNKEKYQIQKEDKLEYLMKLIKQNKKA